MDIALITQTPLQEAALVKALTVLPLDVQAYDVGASLENTLIIGIVTEETLAQSKKLAAKNDFYALTQTGLSSQDKSDFSACFDLPIRLGRLVGTLQRLIDKKSSEESLKPISMGDLVFNPKKNEINRLDSKDYKVLTEKERDILLFLYQSPNHRVTRAALLSHVWQYADTVETHTLETHIYRLRQKIEQDPASPSLLMTEEDGYRLNI